MIMPLALLTGRPLTRNLENALVQLDVEVLRPHARDVHVHDELLVCLIDVGAGFPLGGGDESNGPAVGDFIEVDVQLVGEMHRE